METPDESRLLAQNPEKSQGFRSIRLEVTIRVSTRTIKYRTIPTTFTKARLMLRHARSRLEGLRIPRKLRASDPRVAPDCGCAKRKAKLVLGLA